VRLAFLTPLPPARTGIADYSVDVLRLLAPRHEIDVFHSQTEIEPDRLPASCSDHPASEFHRRHRERPYDLAIYQMGNGLDHAFLYEIIRRVPGLLVLHDLVLHHSRALMFLESEEARAYARDPSSAALRERALRSIDAYKDEVAYSYPRATSLAEVHLSTVGSLLPYAYPLFRIPVEASRLTAAHNAFMSEAIRDEIPEARVARLVMPVEASPVRPEAAAHLRSRHGFAADAIVVGSFGLITREKRLETLARALARSIPSLPSLRWLLVGPVADQEYLSDLLAHPGIAERVMVAGRVPFSEMASYIEATDIVVHLRYPTARETSAALLRVLAQGRACIVSDLENLAEIPSDAVVRADVKDEEGEVTRGIEWLGFNAAARARLARNARLFVGREHSAARCIESYEAAIERARGLPDPPPRHWPSRWLGP